MIKILELFSGTGSVGKIAKEKGYQVVSLDFKNADINTDIMDWDYKSLPSDSFDIIWASPPCQTFSLLRRTHIGRKTKCFGDKIITAKMLDDDMINRGLPILIRTLEIIEYFDPRYFFVENPQTGRMKDFIQFPYYDVDYCRYADWGYRKRTRIWTNVIGFKNRLCKGDCNSIDASTRRHKSSLGRNHRTSLEDRYRIPPDLIRDLFEAQDWD